jgi:hypothetical protein
VLCVVRTFLSAKAERQNSLLLGKGNTFIIYKFVTLKIKIRLTVKFNKNNENIF